MANSKKKSGKTGRDREDAAQRDDDETPRTGDPIIITGGRSSLQPSTDSPEELGDQTSGGEK